MSFLKFFMASSLLIALLLYSNLYSKSNNPSGAYKNTYSKSEFFVFIPSYSFNKSVTAEDPLPI